MAQTNGLDHCDLGMVGLGVMGRNLLLNMADNGFTVAGFDKAIDKVESLRQEAKQGNVVGATNIEEFISKLRKPRAILFLIPAGKPVDRVIDELLPHLEPGDLIIDAGNSHFTDTNLRMQRLEKEDILFLGVGVSGGEEGARHGPSMMPSGPQKAYERVQKILEAVSAKVNQDPCVTYLGKGSAGHYVKMVHNGIEYAIMQTIAETYDFMKRSLGLSNTQLYEIYKQWNQTELNSYLVEITSRIFAKKDDKTGHDLLDEIVNVAAQNGTGMWTSLSSLELQQPTPMIDVAVSMRDLSVFVKQHADANKLYQRPIKTSKKQQSTLKNVQDALYTAMIIAYAQGMALLSTAVEKYGYQYDMEAVARIWRGGCIIRSELLEDFRKAYRRDPKLSNLLLDKDLSEKIQAHQEGLRQIIIEGVEAGIPMPALTSAVSYLDGFRSAWQPSNLIQAQRDYFGSHTYERIDMPGIFHTQWDKD